MRFMSQDYKVHCSINLNISRVRMREKEEEAAGAGCCQNFARHEDCWGRKGRRRGSDKKGRLRGSEA